MGEVLRESPDIEPSLGAAMDSLRDPLACPHPPTNDRQVVEVVAVMWWAVAQFEMGYSKYGIGLSVTARLRVVVWW